MDALRQIEYAGRCCYRSEDKITENSAPPFVRSLIRRRHLSPLEFADMTVELITSRDVMGKSPGTGSPASASSLSDTSA